MGLKQQRSQETFQPGESEKQRESERASSFFASPTTFGSETVLKRQFEFYPGERVLQDKTCLQIPSEDFTVQTTFSLFAISSFPKPQGGSKSGVPFVSFHLDKSGNPLAFTPYRECVRNKKGRLRNSYIKQIYGFTC